MDKKLTRKRILLKHQEILKGFCDCYLEATGNRTILKVFLERLEELEKHPFTFEPYHQKVREPFDYYKFSLDFIRPLIELEGSKIKGFDVLEKIDLQLKRGENVVLLSNHQTETDPQAIAILLEEKYSHIGEKLICVAGERVVTDPLAIPFSMGCDLLCIYSKRYIDHPPELKMQKQLHNKNTMKLMSRLLEEGGKIMWVAPSGGRDRKAINGKIEIAPFDPSSIEMFHLMARVAKTPTHFYPLTLDTYDLLPPPETIQKELGEMRKAKRCSIQMVFSPEFDMEEFPGFDEKDKIKRRQNRADALWNIVNKTYEEIK
jgi:glycerol-3-phosphate O-acyltransferase